MVDLLRNHRRSGRNGLKLKYMIGPINATLEQSFPPRNSIRKVGCCVLLSRRAVWWGCGQTRYFRQTPTELQLRQSQSRRPDTIAQARIKLRRPAGKPESNCRSQKVGAWPVSKPESNCRSQKVGA